MTKKEKLLANIEAIETVLRLDEPDAKITEEDKIKLKRYSGFGELKCVLLDPGRPEQFSESEKNLIPYVEQLHKVFFSYSKSEQEYKTYIDSIKKSVLTAFYTPPELVAAIDHSFTQSNLYFNNILEPSAGTGVFLNIKGSSYTAIEKDILTGKILKALNPDKNVRIGGFEDIPQNLKGTFNLVISNIPFGDFKVFDADLLRSKNKVRAKACNAIHNYFFEKGLDTLKEGGILAFITSTGVMNSKRNEDFRTYLLTRAKLIGAVRLPQNTFEGTQVQSDLIILQKNSSKKTLSEREQSFITTINSDVIDNFYFNSYYLDKNRIIYTKSFVDTNLYGQPTMLYEHEGGIKGIASEVEKIITLDLRRNLDRKLFNSNNTIRPNENSTPKQLSLFDDFFKFVEKVEKHPEAKKPTEFYFENFTLNRIGSYQQSENLIGIAIGNDKAKVLEFDEVHSGLIRQYIAVRDCYFSLKNYENSYIKESPELRQSLNERYDTFVKDYGTITDSVRFLADDVAFAEIRSLELPVNGIIQKADIFREPVAFKNEKDNYSADEALSISLNKFNKVDLSYISQLTQLKQEEIIDSLENKIFLNPETFNFEPSDVFLSGNVVSKLDKAGYEFKNNGSNRHLYNSVKALINVVPQKIAFEDIGISLGERWVPDSYFSKFATYRFDGQTSVNYNSIIDDFNISGGKSFYAREKYAVQSANRYYSANDVLRFALLDNIPEMTKKVQNGELVKTVPDNEGIQKMNASVSLLQTEFKNWIHSLPTQNKEELENIYNRCFNCYVKPQYNGDFQTFPGLDKDALGIDDLYPSQKNAILLLKNNDGGIIDHEVGGGKTLIQCIAAYEMKRLGLANKPCILGLKANIGQIANTFKTAYPDAKILYTTKDDLSKDNREQFFNKVQNNNWDCIIMTHEQFKAIPQSFEIQRDIIHEEILKIEESIRGNAEIEGVNFKHIEVGLIKRKENLESKLQAIIHNLNLSKDYSVDFKTMGIDHIFVDESHKFKNLMFQTRHQRVAGLGNSVGSDRALNLLFAVRTIQQRSGKDLGATFLSGTTISNSLTELYNIFNYLRPQALKEQNIFSFDAWASIYTLKSKDFEFNVTNDIVQKERFRQFVKVPELAMFYSQITDYKTAEDIGVDRPKKNELFIALDQTEQQKDMFSRLKDFAKTADGTIIFRPPLSDSEHKAKMLIATNTAKKAALDMRLINSELFSDEPNNKACVVVERIHEYYLKYNKHKGTQFVFSDIGTYKPGDNFNIYSDLKQKLIEKGIPAKEIQFIQNATTDKKRFDLFQNMNNGICRILFGSTEMLGTGVNAQERCVAIHHFDIPWTPKDLEQRNGRGVRTGNVVAKHFAENKVDVLVYGTKETLDTYKFNLLKNKALFISQIKSNNISIRTIDEGGLDKDSGMNFAEYIAVLSGNTDLLEKAKLEKVVAQLKAEQTVFLKQTRDRDTKLENFKQDIKNNEKIIELFKLDLKAFQSLPRDQDGKVVHDYIIHNQKMTDVNQIGEALNKILKVEYTDTESYKKVGSFGNFNLVIKADRLFKEDGFERLINRMYVEGNLKYTYNSGDVAKTPKLAAEYAVNALNRIDGLIKSYEVKIKEHKVKIESLEKMDLHFLNKEKLESSIQQLNSLSEKLNSTFNPVKPNLVQDEKEENAYTLKR